MDILILCTGNICRSPMGEAMLRHRLDAIGVDARVHSAGVAMEGRPAMPPGVDVLNRRGLDITSHRSRAITRAMVTAADVVIAMAREHVREAVSVAPDAWPRTFTLKELARRGAAIGARAPDESLEAWLERLHNDRDPRDMLGWSRDDDVADPMGHHPEIYAEIADEIEGLVDTLVALAWAPELQTTEGHR